MSGPDLCDIRKATAIADDAIYARGFSDGEKSGAEKERAAIVAWLNTCRKRVEAG